MSRIKLQDILAKSSWSQIAQAGSSVEEEEAESVQPAAPEQVARETSRQPWSLLSMKPVNSTSEAAGLQDPTALPANNSVPDATHVNTTEDPNLDLETVKVLTRLWTEYLNSTELLTPLTCPKCQSEVLIPESSIEGLCAQCQVMVNRLNPKARFVPDLTKAISLDTILSDGAKSKQDRISRRHLELSEDMEKILPLQHRLPVYECGITSEYSEAEEPQQLPLDPDATTPESQQPRLQSPRGRALKSSQSAASRPQSSSRRGRSRSTSASRPLSQIPPTAESTPSHSLHPSTTQPHIPEAIEIARPRIVSVSAGHSHTLMLDEKGRVFSCGEGEYGKLGLGDTRNRYYPTWVRALPPAAAISAGGHHSLVLSRKGAVFAFGKGTDGQLGVEDAESYYLPVCVMNDPPIIAVSAGGLHSLCLDNTGSAYAFGNNGKGRLGLGDVKSRLHPVGITSTCWTDSGGLIHEARAVPRFAAIAAGWEHTAMLDASGRVFVCGGQESGKLGMGDEAHRFLLAQVMGVPKALALAIGHHHTMVLVRGVDSEIYHRQFMDAATRFISEEERRYHRWEDEARRRQAYAQQQAFAQQRYQQQMAAQREALAQGRQGRAGTGLAAAQPLSRSVPQPLSASIPQHSAPRMYGQGQEPHYAAAVYQRP